MNKIKKNQSGFTLIELMIAVIIVGILAALAVPRFMAASTKSKQSEAQTILKQIYVNQRAYRQQSLKNTYFVTSDVASKDNQRAFRSIWVEIMDGCQYTFTLTATADNFICTAEANIDGDGAVDTWVIDDQGQLINTVNDVNES